MTDLVFTTESLRDAHRRKWGGSGTEVAVYRAPGRVVLRGGAAVAALDAACYVTRSPNAGGELRVISENLGEERRWPVSALPVVQPMGDWSDVVVGAAKELFRAGHGVEPANLRVHSGVPVGAGLGAGVALTVAVALALLDGRTVEEAELLRVCRRAGSRFAGQGWGELDPLATVRGGFVGEWPGERAVVVMEGETVEGLAEMARGTAGVHEAWRAGSGCVVVVVDAGRAQGVEEQIRERYRLAGGVEPRVYRGPAAGGAIWRDDGNERRFSRIE